MIRVINSSAMRSFHNPYFKNTDYFEAEILSEGCDLEGLNSQIWPDYIRYYRTYIVNTYLKFKEA